ncbi:2OG-Fe(II) oxygenase [Chitinilyticum piscinae]|uniref:2OG-Fe(II) oxygenase n=1 Tax=Chitinilyticum piscinae TaxID=2866724 RepID=A0A8J7FHS5_9NEIS|nr:2OG-Fe(II) oxygenase [Chitinilyticum piscinae]MBE9608012.1 2OG-Fe(II) oxygenase [Chitinilyticum piscinae]
MILENAPLSALIDALAGEGWAEARGFLSPGEVARLAGISQARRQDFHRASIGRAAGQNVRDDIRRDAVLWIDNQDPELGFVMQRFADYQQQLNRELYLGLNELELHFAAYPAGGFYQRHLDQHRQQDTRVVTVVLYLNPPDWQSDDGGQLRLYLDDGSHHDVQPAGGTLVTFLSNRFEHEVIPARRERLSLTGWYRRR